MEKFVIIGLLPLFFLIAWCWNKKIEITNTDSLKEYNLESCDKYFKIADCSIEKEIGSSRTDEMRNELRQKLLDQQSSRSGLDNETIDKYCKNWLESLYNIKDHLKEIWCNID